MWATASHGSGLRDLGVPHHGRNSKMMDAMLARMHGAVAIQGQLVNTGAILALYLRQLAEELEEGGSNLAAEGSRCPSS